MRDTPTSDHLELITLNDTVASFSRLLPIPCVTTTGISVWKFSMWKKGLASRLSITAITPCAPAGCFLPTFTLHKVMVDAQAEAIYRRTIIHLDHHAVLKNLRDFPQPGSGWAAFTPRR
jgi:hypothetical protein